VFLLIGGHSDAAKSPKSQLSAAHSAIASTAGISAFQTIVHLSDVSQSLS